MRFTSLKMMVLSTGLVLCAGVASAATITGTYSVVGSNFISSGVAPFASITESFTISFSNTTAVSQQTTGISLNASSTITPTSPLAFTYIPASDTLTVGGTAASVATSDPLSTDFALSISNASDPANFRISSLSYSVGLGSVYTAQTTGKAVATPEPASLALLGSAIAIIGFIRRRKTR